MRRRKSQIATDSVQKSGGHEVRNEQHLLNADAAESYRFHFQITNRGGRQACTVEVQAQSLQDATAFFRRNWPTIESMAREGLAGGIGEDRTIRLAVPQ